MSLSTLDSGRPRVRFRKAGVDHELACDFIAGCDGFHGVCRPPSRPACSRVYERIYPFAWLGILAAVAPSTDELMYAHHERGFALHSLRSPEVSRLYLQVDRRGALDDWSDDRIWDELRVRLATQRRSTGRCARVRSWRGSSPPTTASSSSRCSYGRLFLAGDAAHIVPPTGAKGLNLAVADVRVLADAIDAWYASGATAALDAYCERCLARVWRVQEFSSWMTTLLHPLPDTTAFDERLTQSRLEWICESEAAARSLAENYVGLPFE